MDCKIRHVKNRKDYNHELDVARPDLILSDHYLPDIDSEMALKILKSKDFDIPFIIVSGTLSAETAVDLLNKGATDYLMKDRPERLVSSIKNSLSKFELEKDKINIQNRLIESEIKFRRLVETSSDIFCILNKNFEITYTSPSFENLSDNTPYKSGNSILDCFNFRDPDKFISTINACLIHQENFSGNHLFVIDKNSGSRYLLTSFTNLVNDQVIKGIIVRFNDITNEKNRELEVRENEEKLRLFFENSLDGIILANYNGEVVSANKAASHIFNMPIDEIIGKARQDLFDNSDERVQKMVDERNRNGKAKSEIRMRRKNGDLFPAEISTSTFYVGKGEGKIKKTASIFRDISERKENQKKLGDTAAKLQLAEKIAKLGYWEYNSIDDSIFCSNEIYAILELETINRETWSRFIEMIFEEDRQSYFDTKTKVLKTSTSNEVEFRIRISKDQIKWLKIKIEPLYNENSDHIGLQGTMQDITDSKVAYEKLSLSKNRYKSIVNSQTSYFVRIDMDGNYSFVNRRFIQDFGWLFPNNDPIGYPAITDVVPSDHHVVSEFEKNCKQNPFVNQQVEINKIGKNNTVKCTLWDIVFLPSKDGNSELQCAGTDITARVEAEENNKFQANILSKIGQGVVATDKLLKIEYINAAAEKMFGFPLHKVKGKNFSRLIMPDEDHVLLHDKLLEKLEKELSYSQEFQVLKPDGSFRTIQITFSGIFDKESNLESIICISSDISKLKKSEINLKKLNRNLRNYTHELVSANKGLEQFTYIVSHNLRAPVANIIGLSEIIKDDNYPAEVVEKLNTDLLNNVKRLDNVVKDLNDILKTKADYNNGKEEVEFSPLVDDIIATTRLLFENAKLNIHCDFKEFSSMVTLRSYMYSIFYNLIVNSIKYRNPNRDLKIEISSGDDGKNKFIKFRDNGLGIDVDKKKDQVFGLYKRFHHHIEGKGMGLFMVRTQVDLLGGKIEVDSIPDEYTEFRITFRS